MAIALVTGATSGLGLALAHDLAHLGHQVLIMARDTDRLRAAVAAVPGAAALPADLADLDSVRAAAARVDRLDLLVNNAGVMATPRTLSAQGHELQFAVNHLAHFALTGLLLDRLAAGPAPRVVTVTSVQHRHGRLRWDDLAFTRRYQPMAAYEQSKLANAVFGLELHRRLAAAGSPVLSVLAHPGWAVTGLQTAGTYGLYRLLLRVTPVFAQPAQVGARALTYAATSPAVLGGRLYGPGGWGELRGPVRELRPGAAALDPENARRLWQVSAELTGVTFPVG